MLVNSILLFASAVTALPTFVPSKRSDVDELATETLIQDIDNINAGVLALSAAISAFPGSNLATTLVSGVEMLSAVAAINTANRKGYVDALASPQLNETESARVVDAVLDTVLITIPQSVQITEDKKEALEDAGLGPAILASLELLIYDHDSFSAAVEVVLNGTPDVEAEGIAAVATIHNAIQNGIDDFSS